MPRKPKRKFGNVYLNGVKICANPICWEPAKRIYCSPECCSSTRIFRERKKRRDQIFKYRQEYKVNIPGR